MRRKLIKILFSFAAFILLVSLFLPIQSWADNNAEVNVGLIVTNCGNGIVDVGETCDAGVSGNGACPLTCSASCTVQSCGGVGGGDYYGPAINVVTSSVTNNSFYIKWHLQDDSGIAQTSFSYGIGNYNLLSTVIDLGGNYYETNISGLISGTLYQYKISARDASVNNNLSESTGSFTTTNLVDTPPVISNVNILSGFTTATLSWTVTDDQPSVSVSLLYGPSVDYGFTAVLTGNYSANLSGLSASTTYYYKIIAIDSIGQTVSSTGSFTTLSGDFVAPTISNVTTTPGVTVAIVNFNTDELATAQVLYGLLNDNEGIASSLIVTTTHSLQLSNLLPNRTYLFKIIVTDISENKNFREFTGFSFKTLADVTPPPNVTNFELTTSTNSIILSWINPTLLSTPDFSGVKVLRSINSPVTGYNDPAAVVKYVGSGESLIDYNVLPNITYYYSIFSFDTSNNYSSGVSRSGQIIQNLYEICNNGIDDDSNGLIDCADPTCKNLPNCIKPVEVCNNGIDDDSNGLIDCADSACVSSCVPSQVEICNNGIDDDSNGLIDCADSVCAILCMSGGGEICNNGIDDNNDGKIDCADSNCVAFPSCVGSSGTITICHNEIDDDNDGLIDYPNDPGCSSFSDNDEYNPPSSTVPDFARIDFSKLLFLAGNRKISLSAQNKTITSLAGSNFTLGVPLSTLISTPQTMLFRVDGQSYQFVLSEGVYYSDIIFPGIGNHDVSLAVDYGSGQNDSVSFVLNSLPKGQITGDGEILSEAEVSLLQSGNVLPYLGVYGEQNPVITDHNGLYGWVVVNGDYYLKVKKDGYYERVTPVFSVKNNVINLNINLIKKPEKLLDVIDPKASVGENVIKIAKNLFDKTSAISRISAQAVNDIADNPVVEKTATEVVAPAVVTTVAVSTAATSWLNLIAFLRFLFLQPILLLGRGKREKWGVVYNSLTKLPIDLAIVRLFNMETGKLMQSRVTDGKGRFAFMVDQGKYRLEVQKSNFIFPSVLLKNFKNDGEKVDIYHGENIEVNEDDSLITVNIPLDPIGGTKTPKRIFYEKLGRSLQNGLAWLGFVVTLLALYISPVWYMWILLVLHLFFLFIFRRIALPKKARGWGIVYDAKTNKPVSRVVARLFDSQFNKLIATEVTDRRGRYHFLAGNNKYYVTYEHQEYEPKKIDISDLKKEGEGVIAEDVKMNRNIND